MNKRGGQIILSSVPEPKASYASAKEALIDALNMEKEVNEVNFILNNCKKWIHIFVSTQILDIHRHCFLLIMSEPIILSRKLLPFTGHGK